MDMWKILIVLKFCWAIYLIWFFVVVGIACESFFFFFFFWKFLVMVMEIDELNFCVAEPQESR